MKNYYNIQVKLPNNLGHVPLALHTDVKFGKKLLSETRFNNKLFSHEGDFKLLHIAIYYHLADYFINQHFQQRSIDPISPTILNTIVDTLNEMELDFFEYENDCAAHWIHQGILSENSSLLRKGLFQAFVHHFNHMNIIVEPKTYKECLATSILEFDPTTCIETFKQYGEKECYTVQLDINDCYGNLIEEFYECNIYMHPYLGEMMLYNCNDDIARYPESFYYGLTDALKWHAAKQLFGEHQYLKSEYGLDDPTPLENFWAMALDEGFIEDEEYDEIMNDLTNPNDIGRIYEIIDTENLLFLEDFNRADIDEKDYPTTIHYED